MISLITIHHNRQAHLELCLQGIANNTMLPDEVIIVNMGCLPDIEIPENLNIIWVDVEVDNLETLPLGQSRNIGADHAAGDSLLFLDVDCIPAVDFVKTLSEQLQEYGGLIMGQPKYLLEPLSNHKEPISLAEISVYHPLRPRMEKLELGDDPGMFWSLCFAISSQAFEKLGGFDEQYKGYGAEDTDLSFTCFDMEIPFYLSQAIAYHQQHGFYKPPVNQLEAIVNNCNVFYKKWNHWCMSNHLNAFTELGLIDWNKDQKQPIQLLKTMELFDMDQYFIPNLPYA